MNAYLQFILTTLTQGCMLVFINKKYILVILLLWFYFSASPW